METIKETYNKDVFQFEGAFSTRFDFQKVETYNPINNYLLAQLCGLSYKSKKKIKNQINLWNENTNGVDLELIIKEVDSFRFVIVYTQDYILVTFRGSDNIENWLSDFNIAMVPFKNDSNLLVHKGFYNSVVLMNNELTKAIKKIKGVNQNIYITGHSLGGAQAILSAFVCSKLSDFVNVTTFGEPKIGNLELVNSFNKDLNSSPTSKGSRIYRNINGNDPVPYLPISYWFKFYYHESFFYIYSPSVGSKYEIIKQRNEFLEKEFVEIPKDQCEIFKWNFIHHSITDYIDNAKANKSNTIFDC